PWLSSFSFPGAEGYSQLSLYPPRAQLLVGARNHLFRLNLSSLAVVQSVEWRSDESTIRACISKGRSVDECQNYPKVLLVRGKHVFACGTNAFSPVCARRQAEDLSVTHERVSGVARCPYDPRHHSAALLTPRGELYAATVMDFSGRDPAIYRSLGGLPPLRTAQYNSRWLHDPSFVSVYDIGHFAYFFFRERAVGEATECPNGAGGGIGGAGGGVVSRVARVCKNDQGGRYLLEGTWTTFSKARLDCSSPGEAGGGGGGGGSGVATTYEHLRSTFYLPEQDLVYAVLSTRVSSIEVSAVCAFNLTAIQRAFSGPFAYQEHPRGPWSHRQNPDPNFQCGTASGEEEEGTGVSLEDRHKQVLMQGVVRSATGTPLYADIVQGKEALYHVMYLAT
uniref:Sema domain-containing protein n=1 Tax=Petromyzon marinus TaxID=7757 RepID=S4RU22_PETMA